MKTKLEYFFAHGEGVGNIYHNEKFGRVIVFDGALHIGEPFYFMDSVTKERVTGEKAKELREMIVEIIGDSFPEGD